VSAVIKQEMTCTAWDVSLETVVKQEMNCAARDLSLETVIKQEKDNFNAGMLPHEAAVVSRGSARYKGGKSFRKREASPD